MTAIQVKLDQDLAMCRDLSIRNALIATKLFVAATSGEGQMRLCSR